MPDDLCPCGSSKKFDACCAPIHGGKAAGSPEQLMRARYAAYVKGRIDFLRESLAPDARADFDEDSARAWSQKATWRGLEIASSSAEGDKGTVTFVARYDVEGKTHEHHEVAEFRKEKGAWFFVDGKAPYQAPVVRAAPKVGRNDPCPCGSGRKYKQCCLAKQ